MIIQSNYKHRVIYFDRPSFDSPSFLYPDYRRL